MAECYTPEPGTLKSVRQSVPEAFVIDLSRLPSHGGEVAAALRRFRETRNVPIVFAGGEPEKIERIRAVLPDAVFTEWDRIGEGLAEALRSAPDAPVVPPPMAGYSGTPLAKKLGIKENTDLTLLNSPQGFLTKLLLPENVTVHRRPAAAQRVILFVRDTAELRKRFAPALSCVAEGGGLWIVWPKKASGLAGDLSGNAVRDIGLSHGWVDYKVCAIDETWSGLLFAPRRNARARPA
jgi:hypothetical protein